MPVTPALWRLRQKDPGSESPQATHTVWTNGFSLENWVPCPGSHGNRRTRDSLEKRHVHSVHACHSATPKWWEGDKQDGKNLPVQRWSSSPTRPQQKLRLNTKIAQGKAEVQWKAEGMHPGVRSLRLVFVWMTWFSDQNDPWGLDKGLALPMPVTACPAHHLEAKLNLKYEAKSSRFPWCPFG